MNEQRSGYGPHEKFGQRRFGEFQSRPGMAKNILAVRLRALVEHGILKTAPASDGSVRNMC